MSNLTLMKEAIRYMRRLKIPEINSSIIYIMGHYSPLSFAGKFKYKTLSLGQAEHIRSINNYK